MITEREQAMQLPSSFFYFFPNQSFLSFCVGAVLRWRFWMRTLFFWEVEEKTSLLRWDRSRCSMERYWGDGRGTRRRAERFALHVCNTDKCCLWKDGCDACNPQVRSKILISFEIGCTGSFRSVSFPLGWWVLCAGCPGHYFETLAPILSSTAVWWIVLWAVAASAMEPSSSLKLSPCAEKCCWRVCFLFLGSESAVSCDYRMT